MNHVRAWRQLDAVEATSVWPKCVSSAILISNQHGPVCLLCHDLRVLKSFIMGLWGPSMERYSRVQDITECCMLSSSGLSEGLLQIPITQEDRTYFDFWVASAFYVF